jgi:hypothetical protein
MISKDVSFTADRQGEGRRAMNSKDVSFTARGQMIHSQHRRSATTASCAHCLLPALDGPPPCAELNAMGRPSILMPTLASALLTGPIVSGTD